MIDDYVDIKTIQESRIIKRPITCKYCKLPEGQVHVIGTHPEDLEYAKIEEEKCGSCVLREVQDAIVRGSNPNSERSKAILKDRFEEAERKMKTDEYMHNLKTGKSNAHFFKSKGMRKPMRDVY